MAFYSRQRTERLIPYGENTVKREHSVEENQFVTLQNACRKSFQQLGIESQKSLNLLALVRRFPDSMEIRTALVFQLDTENQAHLEYEKRRRALYSLVSENPQRDGTRIKPKSERSLRKQRVSDNAA